ncbi:gamma-glutamylcyclotransferase [Melghirimyces algeriensis]|uniref:Uncharacterized conserved protein YtfP, gamma-glutamylcyclotransferase (GGCT)/AIG2-like family n=1 Tax=Melghirimyces algeriensis TaxID=910412 RepID=A0A521DLU0_9BACL|nr:gamma-glutamylcyclotransferase [Melghirimyces algeriensis]SMO72694.1 Uncharacterized conserved protein YtfP, gamma-glutamylcyclotransferase (GGCT)/AIG2-like family [Melghirimyces algeriensis]
MHEVKHRVFVYGSLRRGEKYHSLLAQSKPEAMQAWIKGELFDTLQGYPGLSVPGERRVYGELYRVNRETLSRLDELEGFRPEDPDFPDQYRRVRLSVQTDHGSVESDVYLYARPRQRSMKTVPYGDWKARDLKRQNRWLYFAYGSCMDHQRFLSHGVGDVFQQVLGRGILHGYALRFTLPRPDGGRADIVEQPGDRVEGKVYEVEQQGLEYLFWREGVDHNVYRPAWVPVIIDGKTVENVLTFVVIDKKKEIAPPEHYVREILRGSKGIVSDSYHRGLRRRFKDTFGMTMNGSE